MNKTVYKILTWAVLPIVIVVLCVLIVNSVLKPINFNKEKAQRETVAIQRLKDLRTLQAAFKSEAGHYASTFDSLKMFYNAGSITVEMQIGSKDDSVAVENTAALKKKRPKITAAEMLELSKTGEKLVFSIKSTIPVRDTLFNSRNNFSIDSIFVIPFCGEPVQMQTVVKEVSGVPVPLFEAKMPYKSLLRGMDNQLRINLDADRIDTDRYPGLMVGSITAPNNNAGNWE